MSIAKLENMEYSVNKNDKELRILKNISLSVNIGEFHLITGPSGSGKTTLLQLIATILHQTKGFRELFGKEVTKDTSEGIIYYVREKIGYLFQTPYLPTHISTFEYIKLQSQLSGIGAFTAIKKTKELLKELGIDQFEAIVPSKLSGGEKQRVALAGILVKNINLLLLDEPTGSLDFENRTIFWELINQLKNDNLTIIAVTHDESLTKKADYIHKLDYGIMV
ncbi:MAG: ATP-binding cassette domain-containing protein [Candidatus Heimdallarchaeota archaeon]